MNVQESDEYDKRAAKYVVDFLCICRVLKLVMRPDWENEVKFIEHLLNLLKAKDARIGKRARVTNHGMRDVSLAIQDPECECWRTSANLLVSHLQERKKHDDETHELEHEVLMVSAKWAKLKKQLEDMDTGSTGRCGRIGNVY